MLRLSATDSNITVNNISFPKNTLAVSGNENAKTFTILHSAGGTVAVGETAIEDVVIDGQVAQSYQDALNWINSNFFANASSSGEAIPEGTERQLLGYGADGTPIAVTFTPNHWSDFPDGAPTEGQWVAAMQADSEEQPVMGFVRVSTLLTPIAESEGMIPFYTQEGQLRVGIPQFPENAVPLILLDARVPAPPTQGTFTLQVVDGTVTWITA